VTARSHSRRRTVLLQFLSLLLIAAVGIVVWRLTAHATAHPSPDPSGVPIPLDPPPGWKRVFADDFNGPDAARAWAEYRGEPGGDPGGWWDPSHDVVTHGELQLRTYRDPAHCPAAAGCRSFNNEVSGGVNLPLPRVYGTYLVRLRAGNAHGVAIVALLWPASGGSPPEIDFVEDNGISPRTLNTATFHHSPGDSAIRHYLHVDMSRWHTFGVTWRPGSIVYTVDGRAWASVHDPTVPTTPMILALQAQTWDCGHTWERCPYPNATPKVNLDVDWVVVYAPV
jgi:hypothetical protein